MTSEEFETTCKKMTKGVSVTARTLDRMTNDLANAMKSSGMFDSWEIVKSGQRTRMLVVKAESGHTPEEVLARILASYERDIRYPDESATNSEVDGATLVFRFCTRGGQHLVASGEITVQCSGQES